MNAKNDNKESLPPNFNKYISQANLVLEDPDKAKKLVQDADDKFRRVKENKYLRPVLEKFSAIFRLVKAYVSGEYRNVPWYSIGLAVASLLYVIVPIDAIADVIPIIGLSDDAAVIAAAYVALLPVLTEFLNWEKSRSLDIMGKSTTEAPPPVRIEKNRISKNKNITSKSKRK